MIADKKSLMQGWIKAESSNIHKYKYQRTKKLLHVCFNSNVHATYSYEGVPLSVYLYFHQSDEKGRYFASHIKERFTHTKKIKG